jgi:lactate dehydrogenase-like 2-hydroxyacid dehydrogenase
MENDPKPRVVITRPIPEEGLKLLHEYADVTMHDEKLMDTEELKKFIHGADIVISLLTDKLTREVLESAGPQLKAICQYTVGYDNVDLEAAHNLGIKVTNTPGALSGLAVAEFTVNLMFTVARHTIVADTYMRSGKYQYWDPFLYLGENMLGKTVGIIGTGQIGSIFAGVCHNGLKMKVLYNDVNRNENLERDLGAHKVGLDFLLKESDVVSLHVPLLPSTHHLISTEQFKMMKPSAILLNTSRGPVVDEVALVEALKTNQIYGAGIDVFEFEPKLAEGLAEQEHVVLTPHIASATESTRIGMSHAAGRNAIAIIRGETPPNLVKYVNN